MQDEEEAFNRFLAHKHWQAHTHTHSADTPTRKEEKRDISYRMRAEGLDSLRTNRKKERNLAFQMYRWEKNLGVLELAAILHLDFSLTGCQNRNLSGDISRF